LFYLEVCRRPDAFRKELDMPISYLLLTATALQTQPAVGESGRTAGRQPLTRCDIAIEIVTTGDSRAYSKARVGYPEEYKQRWAYSHIRPCGARGAAALASRISATRHSRDTLHLELITAPTRELLDAALFQNALRIVADAGASPEARVFAIRTLMWALQPKLSLRFGGLATGRCIAGFTLHLDTWDGTPLPGNRHEQVEALSRRILEVQTTPNQVRHAVVCALRESHTSD
jgi:hypothetical protein